MAEVSAGIHHVEFWVSDSKNSMVFYRKLFAAIGWREQGPTAFTCGPTTIYFMEHEGLDKASIGPRHICFRATSRKMVEDVAEVLVEEKVSIIRGPVDMPHYSPGYYTIDFRDPNGFVLEVAHIPE